MDQLEINTSLQILKPRKEVFQAIVDPSRMSNYFISESSGPMEEGKTVSWSFPEFEGSFPVEVTRIIEPEQVIFKWEGDKDEKLEVSILLEEKPGNSTLVKIREGKMPLNEKGITWYGRNTAGWANFLACMKAYVEHGINLRKGSFDFMKDEK